MHENIHQIENLSISSFNRDLMKPQRRRHGKVKKAVCLMSETTTLHVHHAFFVHFFAVSAKLRREMTKFYLISIFGKGNGKAINSTICVWTRARCLFFSSNPNSLLLSNWAPWNNREKKCCEVCFLETFSRTSQLSDRNVPIKPPRQRDVKKALSREQRASKPLTPCSSYTPTLKPVLITTCFSVHNSNWTGVALNFTVR